MKKLTQKRILSIVLSLALVASLQLSALPAAFADNTNTTSSETEAAPALSLANEAAQSVSSWDALAQAVADAPEGKTVIAIENTFYVGAGAATIVIPAGKSIALAGASTKIESSGMTNTMFKVEEGATLTLAEGLTLNGGYHCAVVDSQGTVVLDGAEIRQAKNFAISVSGENGNFVSQGGTIRFTEVHAYNSAAVVVKDGAQGTITDITIANNSLNQYSGAGGLFILDAKVTMTGGTIQNNKSSGSTSLYRAGGVLVRTSKASAEALFSFQGGSISNNEAFWGGGVHVDGAENSSCIVIMGEGATISNNNARQAGGGVMVYHAGRFIMNGGAIDGNTSYKNGGGVATFDGYWQSGTWYDYDRDKEAALEHAQRYPAEFTMNGGVISNNNCSGATAHTGAGGGIYVASSCVTLNAGEIFGNYAGTEGGGIYVSIVPYVLHTQTLSVYDNHATLLGGGVWLCPTGMMKLHLNDGMIIADNIGDGAADDVAVTADGGFFYPRDAYTAVTISDRFLGGGAANWHRDGTLRNSGVLGVAQGGSYGSTPVEGAPRYTTEDESEHRPVAGIVDSRYTYALKSVVTPAAIEAGKALATVKIYNNTSPRGGGIGANGGIEIGTPSTGIDIKVVKNWNVAANAPVEKPESIKVNLISGGHVIETQELKAQTVETTSEDGTTKEEIIWEGTFKKLPTNLEYSIEEDVPEGWTVAYEESAGADGNKVVTITNTPIHGKVEVSKQAIFGGEAAELPGATLSVLDTAGKVAVDVLTGEELSWTSGNAPREFSLAPGSYTLREDAAPAGYSIVQEVAFSINEEGTLVPSEEALEGVQINGNAIVLTDALVQREILVSKIDAVSNEELEGAQLTITGADINGNAIEPITWISNGTEHKVVLPAGTYTLTEDQTPLGYLVAESITFTIDTEGNVLVDGADVNGKVVMKDAPEPIKTKKVTVRKVDEDGNPLAGAWFGMEKKLYGPDGAVYIPVGPTDENGIATIEEYLPEQEYIIYEVEAPEGYILDEAQYDVVFDENDNFTITVVNKKKPDEPIVPEEPDTPLNPPTEPDNPTEPEQPTNPDTPTEPEKPTTPEKPTEPKTPTTTITENPTPTTTPRATTGPITGDPLSSTILGALLAVAFASGAGMLASRRRRRG